MKRIFLSWILLLLPLACFGQEALSAHVDYIIDGDTFVTTAGDHVRLLGINTPEKASSRHKEAQPFANKATAGLVRLLNHKDVQLVFDTNKTDRYKRLLAHVYLKDGTWVNSRMVEDGLAHVYTFPDNRAHITELLVVEAKARKAKRGLWSHPRWRLRHAEDTFERSEIGHFYIIRGIVKNVADVRGITYLNFGDDWKTDFTAEIIPDAHPLFEADNIDPHIYKGKQVEVRGIIKPVNGIMVTVSHPEQIQILTPAAVTGE